MTKIITHAQFDAISQTIAVCQNVGMRAINLRLDLQTNIWIYPSDSEAAVVIRQGGGQLEDREEIYNTVHEFIDAYNVVY